MNFGLQPINKEETTKSKVYNTLKNTILIGGIPTGEILTEVKISEMLETSRTPVREAVLELIKEGLLENVPRKGVRIKEISKRDCEQIFMIRKNLEPNILSEAIFMMDASQIDYLSDLIKRQELAMENNDALLFIELDQEFHAYPLTVMKFDIIEQILINMNELTRMIGLTALKQPGRMRMVINEHKNIISAIESKNLNQISQAYLFHLEQTYKALILK